MPKYHLGWENLLPCSWINDFFAFPGKIFLPSFPLSVGILRGAPASPSAPGVMNFIRQFFVCPKSVLEWPILFVCKIEFFDTCFFGFEHSGQGTRKESVGRLLPGRNTQEINRKISEDKGHILWRRLSCDKAGSMTHEAYVPGPAMDGSRPWESLGCLRGRTPTLSPLAKEETKI